MLAETATTEISQKREPQGFDESKKIAREGGTVAGNARREIETKTGRRVISSTSFKTTQQKKLSGKIKNR